MHQPPNKAAPTATSSAATKFNPEAAVFLFPEAYQFFTGQVFAGHATHSGLSSSQRETMRALLGGKGAGLAEMTASGVSVPPGLTITTETCLAYYNQNGGSKLPEGLFEQVLVKLANVEAALDRRLGDAKKPLLLSVRSGAKFSMPGMMDTILNLGLNDTTVKALAKATDNPRFAYDSYRRFIQMYGNVVLDIAKESFEHLLQELKAASGVTQDNELTATNLKELVRRYKELVLKETGQVFPSDTSKQLYGAVEAVFRSWNNPRAIYYRNLNKIDHNLGTAVTVQSMVFGNLDDQSATGVCFTRNPSTGEKTLYGEYLVRAQGEDVVAGIRTPKKIAEMAMELPAVYAELVETVARLEDHYSDMQDIEFTVESGKLYILQTRTGKRTAEAAVRVAVELAEEGILSRSTALMRVDPIQLNQLLLPSFHAEEKDAAKKAGRLLATGLNASPGAAIGEIVFDPSEAEKRGSAGEKVILVRVETCPDDIHGIVPAQGIITSRGGMTSHAAVVARGMGKPCVAGCESFRIDLDKELVQVAGQTLKKGDVISIDGSTGEIFAGAIATRQVGLSEQFQKLLAWADLERQLDVRANADTPQDARVARQFGAQGIGLCRTEHMFMSQDRLPVVQEMILATTLADRQAALNKLLPMQREDFAGLFTAMNGLPVTIRLLDPPLHEFLPKLEELVAEVATLKANAKNRAQTTRFKVTKVREAKALAAQENLLAKVHELHETNPMMGLRGCRLGLVYPEINVMQVRAIFEAAIAVKAQGVVVEPEIMIPLIGHVEELKAAREVLERVAREVMAEAGETVNYKFGTMIEIPRAALTAEEIAEYAEFFSFGTNDLTQMTFGYSRDDAEGKFLQHYLGGVEVNGEKRKILEDNPFAILDRKGVGKLMRMAVEDGRAQRPNIKLGICGEHGGDPSSIAFAHSLGLTYVSCSPYRVPVARLAAAQATIVERTEKAGTATAQRDK
ncbi:pyruvate, phosphate dikinase [bacterium]|nr:pyruvate, phosphate dikinase [bacterium]